MCSSAGRVILYRCAAHTRDLQSLAQTSQTKRDAFHKSQTISERLTSSARSEGGICCLTYAKRAKRTICHMDSNHRAHKAIDEAENLETSLPTSQSALFVGVAVSWSY
jgi:hypothetical protein